MEKTDLEAKIDGERFASAAIGTFSQNQLNFLKMVPLSIFGEDLKNEISVDIDNKIINFNLNGKEDFIVKESDSEHFCAVLNKFDQMLKKTIGYGYKTTIVINNRKVYGFNSSAGKTDSNSQRRRTKSVHKVPARKKATTKPKNR